MLNDAEVAIATTNIVQKMTDHDEMFTAFDVTHLARVTVDDEIHHSTVKAFVNQMFANGELPRDYIRTSTEIDVFGNKVRVFVYSPTWKDVEKYDPKHFQDMDSDPFDKKGAPKASHGRDKRGRLCVPVSVMREMGSVVGEKVYVSPENGVIVCFPQYISSSAIPANSRVYIVDRSGNIRISKRVQALAGISNNPNFVASEDEKIEIF